MAELSYDCSVSQGFNFEKDAQILVGHINKLKVSDKEMAGDLAVTNPENIKGDKVKVVGVVGSIYWAGGHADPVQLSCQVSTANKTTLAILGHVELSDTTVEIAFTIYDYDPDKKKYYQCFHTDGAVVKGLIQKSGGELQMAIDGDAGGEVVSPLNFELNLGVMPEDLEQDLKVALSVDDKLAKKWGVTVG
jgi:hypothetical protein